MTPKQRAFCDYYLASGNATEAAEKAGYSQKTARSIGAENLTKPDIKQYIGEHMEKAHETRIADAEEILQYLTNVIRNDHEKTCERTKAAELLGKRYAIFVESFKADGTIRVIMEGKMEDYSG